MSQAEAAINVAEAGDIIADKMDAMKPEEIKEEIKEDVKEEIKEEVETSDIVSEETPEKESSEESEEITEDSKEESKPEETEESPTETFETVADLAEAVDMDINDFLESIKQTVKINGEEMEVSLKDLTAGYQMETDYRRKTTELSEQRKTFEAEKAQAVEQIHAKAQESEQLVNELEKQLMGDFNNINWDQLEADDREEWLVKRQKFGERYQEMETFKGNIQKDLTERNEQMQAKQQQDYQNHLANENELLLQAIPEWSDNDVRGAEVAEMTEFLKVYGFSSEDAQQISDHRIMRLIRDAVKGASKSQKIDVVKKKVRSLPKIVKPSAKTDKRAIKKREAANTWGKYQKSGSMDDLAAHIASKL